MRPGRTGPGRLSPAHQETVDRRLALLEAELVGAAEPPGPVVLPVPGRHAARRPRSGPLAQLQRRVADAVPGRGAAVEPGSWSLGPTHLTVVAVLAALALALTTWWVVRSTPEAVPLPPSGPAAMTTGAITEPLGPGALPSPAASAGVDGTSQGSTASDGGEVGEVGEVVVHVAGDVRRPGLVVLPVGARVADAVEAAGGARRGTDLTGLNLARPLVDGEQVLVGAAAAAAGGAPPGGAPPGGVLGAPPAGAATPSALVDLNTADQALLETLPGVGPVTATAILDWREEHGGFTAVEELLEVDGIGEATLEDLAPLVTV